MRLLLDTQILVWMVNGDRRFRLQWIDAFANRESSLHVSVVVAFEYAELQMRKRLPVDEPMAELVDRFGLAVEGLPGECWRLADNLPPIHRDPVDRMLVAHALSEGMTLITADANIRRYPVECI